MSIANQAVENAVLTDANGCAGLGEVRQIAAKLRDCSRAIAPPAPF
jgi:hypothetical protein